MPVKELIGVALPCLALGAITAWLNHDHVTQNTIYKAHYLALAEFFLGQPAAPEITYPLWGYPLVLALLRTSEFASALIQVILATISLLFVYREVRPHLQHSFPLTALCLLSIPWYSLASLKLADIYSASLGVVALCVLARAVERRSRSAVIGSGLCFGAALNFRGDFLPVLAMLPVVALVLAPSVMKRHWKRFALVIVLAVLCLVPWGLFRVSQGKPFGISTTNAGMVLYNSLGFPGNAWDITRNDLVRTREMKEAFGEDVAPYSVRGDRYFRTKFIEAVRSNPSEFCRKVLYNFKSTLKVGFYVVEIEPHLSREDRLRYEILKEQLKALAGAEVNQLDIDEFRNRGIWDDDFSLTSVSGRQWLIASTRLLPAGLSAVYLVTLLTAIGWLVLFAGSRLHEPIFLCCVASVVCVWSLVCLIQFESRQLNLLYVLGMPPVALFFDRVADAGWSWLRARSG